MIIEVVGNIYKGGRTKGGKNYYCLLVKRPDGQSDSVTVFTDKEHKIGAEVKIKVNAYIQTANEV